MLGLTIDLTLRVVRIGHMRRCLSEARDLLDCMQQLQKTPSGKAVADPTILQELVLKSNLLAKSLSVKRTYMIDPTDASSSGAISYQGLKWEADGRLSGQNGCILEGQAKDVMLFDPRFLVFEFIHNVMLRDQQVELVQEFMSAVSDPKRGSTCQQLIMGAGKTTVVCPLLALMLADSQRLVMQVLSRSLSLARSRALPLARSLARMLADSQRLVMEVPPAHTAQFDPVSRSRSRSPRHVI